MFKFPAVRNKFQPRLKQTYRFIGVPSGHQGNLSLSIGRRVWSNSNADKARLAVNNVFETIGEAKAVRTKIVAALTSAQASYPTYGSRRW